MGIVADNCNRNCGARKERFVAGVGATAYQLRYGPSCVIIHIAE
jgi:hypothetical protein